MCLFVLWDDPGDRQEKDFHDKRRISLITYTLRFSSRNNYLPHLLKIFSHILLTGYFKREFFQICDLYLIDYFDGINSLSFLNLSTYRREKNVDMHVMNSFMKMTATTKEQSKLFGALLYLLNNLT